jgi:heterotetrameric sarcosine oxidase gamma subunit
MAELVPVSNCPGLTVQLACGLHMASLRHFSAAPLAALLQETTGARLPANQQACQGAGGEVTLAWRSPSEILLLSGAAQVLQRLGAKLEGSSEACLVDLSAAFKVVRLAGPRISDLLCRLGGTGVIPKVGAAHRGRLCDVPVLAVSVCEAETWLVLERVFLPHVLGWIAATLADF